MYCRLPLLLAENLSSNYVYLRLILKLVCIPSHKNCLQERAQKEGLDPERGNKGEVCPGGADLT